MSAIFLAVFADVVQAFTERGEPCAAPFEVPSFADLHLFGFLRMIRNSLKLSCARTLTHIYGKQAIVRIFLLLAFINGEVHPVSKTVVGQILYSVCGVSGVYEVFMCMDGEVCQVITQQDIVIIVGPRGVAVYAVGYIKIFLFLSFFSLFFLSWIFIFSNEKKRYSLQILFLEEKTNIRFFFFSFCVFFSDIVFLYRAFNRFLS